MKKGLVLLLTGCALLFLTGSLLASGQNEGEPGSAGPVELTFAGWAIDSGVYDRAMLDAFETANPDVKLRVFDISAKEYIDKITIMLAGDEDVDVFYVKEAPQYAGLVARNQILAVDDLLANDTEIDINAYGDSLSPLKIEGKVYGLPYRSDPWCLFYSKDYFDKSGVAYPTNDWTWGYYKDISKKMTAGTEPNKTYGTYVHTWIDCYVIPGLQINQANLLECDYADLKPALDLFTDIQLVDKSAIDYATNKSVGNSYRIMETGKVASVVMGTWFINQLIQDEIDGKHNTNWSLVQVPTWKGDRDSTAVNTTPVVLNSKSKHQDVAWELAKFLGGPQGAKILADYVMIPGYKDSNVMATFTQNKYFPKDAVEGMKTDLLFALWPPSKLSAPVNTMVNEEIKLAVTGNKTVDEAIHDMTSRREEILKQYQ